MTHRQWRDRKLGTIIDYDKKYGGQCHPAGAMVLLADGTYKAIENIKEGDSVVGFYGNNTVIGKTQREAECVLYRTHLSDIIVTPEHPYLMKSGAFKPIATATKTGEKPEVFTEKVTEESGLTDSELLFLGFWLGDGSLRIHHDCRNDEIIVTHNRRKDVMFLDSLNISLKTKEHHECENACVSRLYAAKHERLASVIRQCYDSARNKILVGKYTNRECLLIIEGLIAADGSTKHKSDVICNTSLGLLLAVQAAALRCGFSTAALRLKSIAGTPTTFPDGSGGRKHGTRKKDLYTLTLARNNKNAFVGNYVLDTESAGIKTVYHLSVTGDHTYTVNNYYVHNCVDVFRDHCASVDFITDLESVGGAHELYTRYEYLPKLSAAYFRIQYQEGLIPPEGAKLIWGATANNSFGHVAIADEGSTQTLLALLEQDGFRNDKRDVSIGDMKGLTERKTIYTGLLGWLVLREVRMSSAPSGLQFSDTGRYPTSGSTIATSDRNAQLNQYWYNPTAKQYMILTQGGWRFI